MASAAHATARRPCASRDSLSDLPRDGGQQVFVLERLRYILVRALLHTPEAIALLVLATDQDDARMLCLGRSLQLPAHLIPVLLRQQNIEQDQLRLFHRGFLQRLFAV